MTEKKKEPQFKNIMNFESWVQYGIENNWITPGFCYTHDGDPYMTKEEEKEWDEGGDPCFPVFKYIG